MSKDEEFLLYPLDIGEDPVCLSCSAVMTVVAREARETEPDFITFRARTVGSEQSL
jgi:hypothetical protein